MRRLKRTFTGFLLGGAVGGTMDPGSTLILMPSGPPFWAIIGAFFGSIVGALYGAISSSSSQGFTYIKSGGRNERVMLRKQSRAEVELKKGLYKVIL